MRFVQFGNDFKFNRANFYLEKTFINATYAAGS